MELRAVREASGKTQAQVAKEAGISETHYQNIEYGKNKPCADIAIRIGDALGVKTLQEFRDVFGAVTTDNTNESDGNRANKDTLPHKI